MVLSPVMSTVSHVVLLAICCIALSCGKNCDPTKYYSIPDKATGDYHCLLCPDCDIGFEPSIPCGKIVAVDDPVGECKPCGEETYSSTKDKLPCKPIPKFSSTAAPILTPTKKLPSVDTKPSRVKTEKLITYLTSNGTNKESEKRKSRMTSGKITAAVVGTMIAIVLIIAAVVVHFHRTKVKEYLKTRCVHFRMGGNNFPNDDNDFAGDAELMEQRVVAVNENQGNRKEREEEQLLNRADVSDVRFPDQESENGREKTIAPTTSIRKDLVNAPKIDSFHSQEEGPSAAETSVPTLQSLLIQEYPEPEQRKFSVQIKLCQEVTVQSI